MPMGVLYAAAITGKRRADLDVRRQRPELIDCVVRFVGNVKVRRRAGVDDQSGCARVPAGTMVVTTPVS